MRTVISACFLSFLAASLGGCSGSPDGSAEFNNVAGKAAAKSDTAPSKKAAPSDRAPHADAPKDAPRPPEAKAETTDPTKSSESITGAKTDPVAPKPMMDEAHTGTAKRKRPEQELASGILTAGSFDDNLYPQFFRSFINKAGQNPHVGAIAERLIGQRVEIFVKNGAGSPVGNARVRIKARGGKAVDLITRSDGRAIFLSSLDQMDANGGLTVEASAGPNNQPVVQRIGKDEDRCTLILPAAAATLPRNLDLAIVLDTTGSMKDELNFLKAEVRDIASAIAKQFPNVDMRFALVCYRDEGMGDEYITRKFDFTASMSDFHSNLAAQNASGGGDTPEAMQKGLEDAVNLSWRDVDTARMVFLIADAPPHARDAATTLGHLNTLRKRGTAVYPLFASSNDRPASEAAEVVLRSAALITGAQYLFLTDDSGVGDSHAEPHIPYYHVEKLNQLVIRMIAGELSGKRTDPDVRNIIRTVGAPPNRPRQD